jgi:hypothetical protein
MRILEQLMYIGVFFVVIAVPFGVVVGLMIRKWRG